MRMWNVNPSCLCRKHLLGEHVEMHMFVGTIKAGKSLEGYFRDKLLDSETIQQRHDALAEEMLLRGMNHNSPLQQPTEFIWHEASVDVEENKAELVRRCEECRTRIEGVYGKLWPHIPKGGDGIVKGLDLWYISMTGLLIVDGGHATRAKAVAALEKARRAVRDGLSPKGLTTGSH